MITFNDFFRNHFRIVRHETQLDYQKSSVEAVAELENRPGPGNRKYKTKNEGKLVNSVLWEKEEEPDPKLHAWGHTLFATNIYSQMVASGEGSHETTAEGDTDDTEKSLTGMRLVKNWDDGDDRFQDYNKFGEKPRKDAASGKPIPYGASAFVIQGSEDKSKERLAVECFQFAIDQEGGEYSTIFWTVENGALIQDSNTGSHSFFWNKFDENGVCTLARNLKESGPDDNGFGLNAYNGDGYPSSAEVEITDFSKEKIGGGVGTSKVTLELMGSERPDLATMAYETWERYGPQHPGHAEFDKHNIGKNKYNEHINSDHTWTKGYFYFDRFFDAPLKFEPRPMKPPGEMPYKHMCHIVFDPEARHEHETGMKEGMWYVYGTHNTSSYTPPWTPFTWFPGEDIPIDSIFQGLLCPGNEVDLKEAKKAVAREKANRKRSEALARAITSGLQINLENEGIDKVPSDVVLIAPAGYPLDVKSKQQVQACRTDLTNGFRSMEILGSSANTYDGQFGYEYETLDGYYENKLKFTPAILAIDGIAKTTETDNNGTQFDYAEDITKTQLIGGETTDGYAYITNSGKRHYMKEESVLGTAWWLYDTTIGMGWLEEPDSDATPIDKQSVFFKPIDNGGKWDLDLYFYETGAVRTDGILNVHGWIAPTGGIFKADDVSQAYGNTPAAPRAESLYSTADTAFVLRTNNTNYPIFLTPHGTGYVGFNDGTAANPSRAFISDTDCGEYLHGADTLGFSKSTNHLDNMKAYFGTANESYLSWESANNRLRMSAPQVYYSEPFTDPALAVTNPIKFAASYSPTANSANTFYPMLVLGSVGGANALSGILAGAYIEMDNYNTNSVSTLYGVFNKVQHYANSPLTRGYGGLYQILNRQNNTISTAYGGRFEATNSAAGSMTKAFAGFFQTYNVGTGGGTIPDAYGSSSYVYNNTTPAGITNGYCYYAGGGQLNAAGSITNLYSYYVADPTATGTITNHYGIYLENQNAATNNWAIYSAGGQWVTLDDVHILADDKKLYFGATDDAEISYTGTHLLIDSTADYTRQVGNRFEITDGNNNICIGEDAGLGRDAATQYNVAVGDNTLGGAASTAVGVTYCTAFGHNTLANITTGDYNTVYGANAGAPITTSVGNSFFGYDCGGLSIPSATGYNSAFGYRSGAKNQGYHNTWFGAFAGYCNGTLTGNSNSGFGYGAQYNLDAASNNNCSFGKWSSRGITTGDSNSHFGTNTGYSSNVSNSNYFGFGAGQYETASNKLFIHSFDEATEAAARTNSIIYGVMAQTAPASQWLRMNVARLEVTDQNFNVMIGEDAGLGRSAGAQYNSGLGYKVLGGWAGAMTAAADFNMGFGYLVLGSLTSGSLNTGVGTETLKRLTTGTAMTAIGNGSFINATTSSNCIGIGAFSGRDETASNKLFIHSFDEATEAAARTNSIIYGEMVASTPASQELYLNANVHIKHDDVKFYWGATDDVSAFFNGTQLEFDGADILVSDDIQLTDDNQLKFGDVSDVQCYWDDGNNYFKIHTGTANSDIVFNAQRYTRLLDNKFLYWGDDLDYNQYWSDAGQVMYNTVATASGGWELLLKDAGGTLRSRLNLDTTETVFNDSSQDINFRVESDGDANAIFVDAGNDRVGIFTGAPTQPFEVTGDSLFNDDVILKDDTAIRFGTDDDSQVYYDDAGGTQRLTFSGADLEVDGSIYLTTDLIGSGYIQGTGRVQAYNKYAANHTIDLDDYTVDMDATAAGVARVVTLPAASAAQQVVEIMSSGTFGAGSSVTIATNGTDTVMGFGAFALSAGECWTLHSDGVSDWVRKSGP